MQPLSSWENLLLGALALLLIFWMSPGIKAALAKSKTAKADWTGFLIPISLVILFVMLLIVMVKN